MDVSPQNFPTVYKAFHLIELDNGGINRMNPDPGKYPVPEHVVNQLPTIEKQLLCLTDDELEQFCNGEVSHMEGMTEARGLHESHKFLNLFFENWIEDRTDGTGDA